MASWLSISDYDSNEHIQYIYVYNCNSLKNVILYIYTYKHQIYELELPLSVLDRFALKNFQ